jgi:hypothetical protein
MILRAFGIALLTLGLSGCWVMDELDKSSKKIDMYTGKSAEKAQEEEPVVLPKGKRQRLGDYFANQKNARTLTKGQLPGDIVSCKLGSSTQFMKQSECLHRGGIPQG